MTSLFKRFSDPENLKKAFEYIKPRKGMKYQDQIPDFWGIAIIDEINDVYFKYLSDQIRNDKYKPQTCRDFYVPKGSFTTRKILVPYVTDRILYQAFFNHNILGESIDQDFCDNLVFAHRLDYTKENFLKHYEEQYERYEQSMLQAVEEGFIWELKLDIVGFFDNIDLRKLRFFLYDSKFFGVNDERLLDLLFKILNEWTFRFKDPEYRNRMGIPQGLQTSGFLSNTYLTFLDKKFKDHQQLNHYYLRYCDDIRVYCRDRNSALTALNLIDHSLGRIGLNLNTKKISLKKITVIENFKDNLIFPSKLVLEKPEPKETVVTKEPPQNRISHKKILAANDIPYLTVDPEKIFSDDRIDEIIEREIDTAIDLEIDNMANNKRKMPTSVQVKKATNQSTPDLDDCNTVDFNIDNFNIDDFNIMDSKKATVKPLEDPIIQSVENIKSKSENLKKVNKNNLDLNKDKEDGLKSEGETSFKDLLANIKEYLNVDTDEKLVPQIPRKYLSRFKFLLPKQENKDFTEDVLEFYEKLPDAEQHMFSYLKKNPKSDLTFETVLNRLKDYSSGEDFVFDWYIYHYIWIIYWAFKLDEIKWNKFSKLIKKQINLHRKNGWNCKNWFFNFLIIRLLLSGPRNNYGRLPLEQNIEFILDFIKSTEDGAQNSSKDHRKQELKFYTDQYKIAALIGLSRLIQYKSNPLKSEENSLFNRNHLNLKILNFFKACLKSDNDEVSSFAIYFIQNSFVLWNLLKEEILQNYSDYDDRTQLYMRKIVPEEIETFSRKKLDKKQSIITVEIRSSRKKYEVKVRENGQLPPSLFRKIMGAEINVNAEKKLTEIFNKFDYKKIHDIRSYTRTLQRSLFEGKFINLIESSRESDILFLIHEELFFIPIELLSINQKFLCEIRPISRMILYDNVNLNEDNQPNLNISNALFIYDTNKDKPLPESRKEIKELKALFESSKIKVDVWPKHEETSDKDNLIEVINEQQFDLIHFSSHAINRANEKSGWILNRKWDEDESYIFTSEDINKLESVPAIVFANACQSISIQNWEELNQPHMAMEFLKKGTVNFIGTNWNLRDDVSAEFSPIFYKKLFLDKKKIGIATQETRNKIASNDLITALNYVLFGSPITLVTTD